MPTRRKARLPGFGRQTMRSSKAQCTSCRSSRLRCVRQVYLLLPSHSPAAAKLPIGCRLVLEPPWTSFEAPAGWDVPLVFCQHCRPI